MEFCSKEQKKEETIAKVEVKNNEYCVKYLDYSESKYYDNSKNRLQELEKLMIEQAKKRDELEYENLNIKKIGDLIIWVTANFAGFLALNKDMIFLMCVLFLIKYYFLFRYIKHTVRHMELKKYRILLDNYKEIKENKQLNRFVELNSYDRIPIDIFHIDEFTLNEMQIIKKQLKKIKKTKV